MAIVLHHPPLVLIGPVGDEAHISFSTKSDSIFGTFFCEQQAERRHFSTSVCICDAFTLALVSCFALCLRRLMCFVFRAEPSELVFFFVCIFRNGASGSQLCFVFVDLTASFYPSTVAPYFNVMSSRVGIKNWCRTSYVSSFPKCRTFSPQMKPCGFQF